MKGETLKSLAEMGTFAEAFLAAHPQGVALGLVGDLGAGKTTFVRACVEAICRRNQEVAPRVVSPSYVIQQSYRKLIPPVEHFDLYRMEELGFEQLVDMGYFEALEETRMRNGFVFVEWPERAQGSLLQLNKILRFEITSETERRVISQTA